MYGPVRPLDETLARIGIAPKRAVSTTEDGGEKEKLDKKRIIEEARRARKQELDKPSGKSRVELLLEEVESISKELSSIVQKAKQREQHEEEDKCSEIAKGMMHVQKFCESVIKKFEWRDNSFAKNVSRIFTIIRDEAKNLIDNINKGQISEENKVKTESIELIRRFVEAVDLVKDQVKVRQDILSALKEKVNIK